MTIIERTYGSKYHFQGYRDHANEILDAAFLHAIGGRVEVLTWLYPTTPGTAEEPAGIEFLSPTNAVRQAWHDFWPTGGRQPSWDGIAKVQYGGATEWLIVEAKANQPEFASPPSEASELSLKKIRESLKSTQIHLGVHRSFCWHGTYYQYANRLAFLYFLNVVARIPARLVFLYFMGETFPDRRPCPKSEERWKELINACHLTLGIPKQHALTDRVHDLFLKCGP